MLFKGLIALALAATSTLAQQWPSDGKTGTFEVFLTGQAECGALWLQNKVPGHATYTVNIGAPSVKFHLVAGVGITYIGDHTGITLGDAGYNPANGKWKIIFNVVAPETGIQSCGCGAAMSIAIDVPLKGGAANGFVYLNSGKFSQTCVVTPGCNKMGITMLVGNGSCKITAAPYATVSPA
ncbi:uncharacterized protein L969DRAFT_92390 [Mixia osmundae IAM 14324]|uniref:Uncharacterized protein n=1 Tax=Mixia osmundae (strain CBS 9802 / IAM 14324 / JCM 22182 / KY 12970) TaxID=764103 RepID=G7DXP2_MIXOS|nr:uncharacterized protein L969DRAFT_92390 [Mixia osmundae IAM 14324]KEI41157.1 hypothetical protein L969DRAFT_92390 [Mixia osmundae IAM 14324]GAA95352.1 hypothetical protein E5Q_02009 [Mixia osmundae IAM 14324]